MDGRFHASKPNLCPGFWTSQNLVWEPRRSTIPTMTASSKPLTILSAKKMLSDFVRSWITGLSHVTPGTVESSIIIPRVYHIAAMAMCQMTQNMRVGSIQYTRVRVTRSGASRDLLRLFNMMIPIMVVTGTRMNKDADALSRARNVACCGE